MPKGYIRNPDKPWKDKEKLKEAYHRLKSERAVADEFNCGRTTIHRWLKNHNIEFLNPREEKPWRDKEILQDACERFDHQHEVASELGCSSKSIKRAIEHFDLDIEWNRPNSKKGPGHGTVYFESDNSDFWEWGYEVYSVGAGKDRETIRVHRLIAIAEFGVEEVKGKVIHHKNECKYDNRPENLEPLTNREHTELHNKKGNFCQNGEPHNKGDKASKEKCERLVKKYVIENGEEPTVREYRNWKTDEMLSYKTIANRCGDGSWSEAKDEILPS